MAPRSTKAQWVARRAHLATVQKHYQQCLSLVEDAIIEAEMEAEDSTLMLVQMLMNVETPEEFDYYASGNGAAADAEEAHGSDILDALTADDSGKNPHKLS